MGPKPHKSESPQRVNHLRVAITDNHRHSRPGNPTSPVSRSRRYWEEPKSPRDRPLQGGREGCGCGCGCGQARPASRSRRAPSTGGTCSRPRWRAAFPWASQRTRCHRPAGNDLTIVTSVSIKFKMLYESRAGHSVCILLPLLLIAWQQLYPRSPIARYSNVLPPLGRECLASLTASSTTVPWGWSSLRSTLADSTR